MPSHAPYATLLLLALAGCAPKPRAHTVSMEGFGFQPKAVEAAVGDTIVFVNRDFVPHNVVSEAATVASPTIAPQATWRFVPKSAGSVEYRCTFHPTMTGTIRVE